MKVLTADVLVTLQGLHANCEVEVHLSKMRVMWDLQRKHSGHSSCAFLLNPIP